MTQSTAIPIVFVYCFAHCFLGVKSTLDLILDTGAQQYLTKYGYIPPPMDPRTERIITAESFSRAISNFQQFMGLNVTGIMDAETSYHMTLPRCGVKDQGEGQTSRRSKRFITSGSWWGVQSLTYKISSYPYGLSRQIVKQEIARAFALWSEYTDLTFTPKRGVVDIEIRFEHGWHEGDTDPFDGLGGTLGHALPPIFGGDVHFDRDEVWTAYSYRGTNLYQVAVHELGHALGLSHSNNPMAVMAPLYMGFDPNFMLDSDDIAGIQQIYGPKTQVEDPECADPKVDTIFLSAAGAIYVFTGQYYWKLLSDGIAPGYPRLISTRWRELPGNIDAAFTYANGKTYFFKGSQYWRYVGTRMDGNYPMEISVGFAGIPDNIDAATVWTGDGRLYFFKGSQFWEFDPVQRPPVSSSYPKPISDWGGLPNDLDAAVPLNGYTYFFKGGDYYLYNDTQLKVGFTGPMFTRENGYGKLGCFSRTYGDDM